MLGFCQRCIPLTELPTLQCDEKKPACSACIRHGQTCSFLDGPPATAAPEGWSSNNAGSISPNRSSPSTPTSGGEGPSRSGAGSGIFSLSDMRLLHHFTSETAPSVAFRPELLEVFVQHIPRLGYVQEYVMRAILAVAALHIASASAPSVDEAMVATASYHINEGLLMSRFDLANLSEQNCHTAFAFSALVSLYSFALPLYQNAYGIPGQAIDRLIESMELIRGSATVVASGHAWVSRGPLKPILDHANRLPPVPNPTPPQVEAHLQWLGAQTTALDISAEESAAYQEALWSLDRSLKLIFSPGSYNRTNYAMSWAAFVPPLFLQSLKLRKPPALAILGYFCPLLQRQWGGWIVSGWQAWLLGDVEAGLHGTLWCDTVMLAAAQLDRTVSRTL